MSEKLKGCPIPKCGGRADHSYPVGNGTDWVGCSNRGCPLKSAPMPFDAWQALPRVPEDAGEIATNKE